MHVALSEQQRQCGLGESVIGIGSNDLWGWLHEHSESGSVHPNVDEISLVEFLDDQPHVDELR